MTPSTTPATARATPDATSSSGAGVRRRGRPPAFDRAQVVEELVRLFWERGYEGAGHEEMRARTGLSGSSLTNAFGGKAQIFDAALERYHEMTAPLVNALAQGSRGLADLEEYLDALEAHVRGDGTPAGCLMISTWAQPIGREPGVQSWTRAYRNRWREAFTAALARAHARREVAPGVLDHGPSLLLAAHTGAMVAAVDDPSGEEALPVIHAMRHLLATWRLPARSPATTTPTDPGA